MDDKIIKLYIQDQNGERVGFKVKTSAPFQKIANEYCKRKDVQINSYNFLIDSDRVNLLRTIEELGLDSENEEENIVSAVILQHGGGGVDGDDNDENSKAITLRVRYDGEDTAFKVKKTTKFDKIFNAFNQRKGIDNTAVQFFYDGKRLNKEDTPKMQEMEDEDIIDAMLHTVGG